MNLLIPFRVERKKNCFKNIFGDENIGFTRISVIRAFNILLLFTFITIVIITLSIDLSTWSRFKLSILAGSFSRLAFESQFGPFSRQTSNQDEYKSNRRYKYSSQLNLLSWSTTEKPWFMINGTIAPNPSDTFLSRLPIFPEDDEPWSDRIVNQLMYIPTGYNSSQLIKEGALKKILLLDKGSWGRSMPSGQDVFLQDSCPVNTCEITFDNKQATTADAIIFKDHYAKPKHVKSQNQIWILYILESPLHTPSFRGLNDLINWTASYRHDSDIVTPYEKFVYYDSDVKAHSQSVNYAKGKTKKVAWFVSNCSARNKRLQYARSLAKYIQVDIFGRCGSLRCSRTKADECFDKLDKEYKFYLSFENSNCRDYITEKFYSNGLNHSVIPIVMGAHPEDYKRSAPANSFIHVDDFPSPHHLAQYLDQLDSNDTLFNQYFTWKGSGEFINTYFWCRLCAMLHAPIKPKNYDNLANWWYPSSICNSNDWL